MGIWDNEPHAASLEDGGQLKAEKLVCVTGSWGTLGLWIVKFLLEKGYSVRSTISITTDEAANLKSCAGGEKRLQLAKADLLDYRTLFKLFQGCIGVFYVPSPNYYINGAREYPAETIDHDVRCVLNVVEACANSQSVKRLMLTSCMSAILWDKQFYSSKVVVDERNWSNLDFCKKEKLWSALSKTTAERAAWALARDRGLDLLVMNPASVLGPRATGFRSSTLSAKSSTVLDQSGILAYIHVDDLAEAHVLAFEADRAVGRYICFERLLTKTDILEAAKQIDPNYYVSQRLESFEPCKSSNQKLLGLGMKFNSRDVTAGLVSQ